MGWNELQEYIKKHPMYKLPDAVEAIKAKSEHSEFWVEAQIIEQEGGVRLGKIYNTDSKTYQTVNCNIKHPVTLVKNPDYSFINIDYESVEYAGTANQLMDMTASLVFNIVSSQIPDESQVSSLRHMFSMIEHELNTSNTKEEK